ncbi:MAG: aminotransferase class V-fold PLP-dependent enzyme [Acidobacteria bacterium]|nr:aminotransferase class V-fold PLP-dependent enzyme [Acidobacteriota bacterium]
MSEHALAMTRRRAAALPLLAAIAFEGLWKKALEATGRFDNNIYTRIGVRPFINARGTWTYLSGSLELPEVQAAKQAAAGFFVDIFELQQGAGAHLAKLAGAEAAMITSGAAGAMSAAAAACMAGSDPEKIWQLPDTTGMKGEVIMLGGRNAFDSAIRLTGAKLVVVGRPEELGAAITPATAMIYTTMLDEPLRQAVEIAKKAGVPLLLDDAAGIPPVSNMRLYAKMGLDLYCFSGGKGLRGPQCSGVLFGRKDLIEAARKNCSPYEGAICRSMKVGKEEVMGLVAAVEAWMKMDLDALNRQWNERVKRIAALVETVPGVRTEITIPEGGNRYPTLTVSWDEAGWGFTVADCDRLLRAGSPRIEVLTASNPSMVSAAEGKGHKGPRVNRLQIISMTLQAGEELVVGGRLREILAKARRR